MFNTPKEAHVPVDSCGISFVTVNLVQPPKRDAFCDPVRKRGTKTLSATATRMGISTKINIDIQQHQAAQ